MGNLYHAIAIDRFYADLMGGQIRGVFAGPALALDAHQLYRYWCERRQIPSMASPAYFVRSLSTRQGVPSLRKRYAMGNQVLGPHGVLYFSTPPGLRVGFEFEWLGDCLLRFRSAVATHVACERQEVPGA